MFLRNRIILRKADERLIPALYFVSITMKLLTVFAQCSIDEDIYIICKTFVFRIFTHGKLCRGGWGWGFWERGYTICMSKTHQYILKDATLTPMTKAEKIEEIENHRKMKQSRKRLNFEDTEEEE